VNERVLHSDNCHVHRDFAAPRIRAGGKPITGFLAEEIPLEEGSNPSVPVKVLRTAQRLNLGDRVEDGEIAYTISGVRNSEGAYSYPLRRA